MDIHNAANDFDHVAHGIMDLVVPALIAWVLTFARKQYAAHLAGRATKRAATAAVAALGGARSGTEIQAVVRQTSSDAMASIGANLIPDRAAFTSSVMGEVGLLLAATRKGGTL